LKIYTGFGDKGQTQLLGGQTVDKDYIRVEVYGTLDELNSVVGFILAQSLDNTLRDNLVQVQHDIFSISAELATGEEAQEKIFYKKIAQSDVTRIENLIDRLDEQLDPLKNFILPGGSQVAVLLHMARTVCRRAERRLTTLMKKQPVRNVIAVYINRLSDLFFIAARYANKQATVKDIVWKDITKAK
jgi:cob(I)alamin adenosyltransferase